MKGLYRLCLTPSSLTLIKVDQCDPPETLEFPVGIKILCASTLMFFSFEKDHLLIKYKFVVIIFMKSYMRIFQMYKN